MLALKLVTSFCCIELLLSANGVANERDELEERIKSQHHFVDEETFHEKEDQLFNEDEDGNGADYFQKDHPLEEKPLERDPIL